MAHTDTAISTNKTPVAAAVAATCASAPAANAANADSFDAVVAKLTAPRVTALNAPGTLAREIEDILYRDRDGGYGPCGNYGLRPYRVRDALDKALTFARNAAPGSLAPAERWGNKDRLTLTDASEINGVETILRRNGVAVLLDRYAVTDAMALYAAETAEDLLRADHYHIIAGILRERERRLWFATAALSYYKIDRSEDRARLAFDAVMKSALVRPGTAMTDEGQDSGCVLFGEFLSVLDPEGLRENLPRVPGVPIRTDAF